MNKDCLGDRMKGYENITRMYLPNRLPVIVRLDGKAFHTFTRGFKKPFDEMLIDCMLNTTYDLCKEIEGVKFAYTQSDEISLLIINDDTWETQPWFGNNIQKIVSVAASIATRTFNRYWTEAVYAENDYYLSLDQYSEEILAEEHQLSLNHNRAQLQGALFDARVFVIPKEEVCNYFIWRQQDAIRNSIQMVGQTSFSHKELHKKTSNDILEMLRSGKKKTWESYPLMCQRGTGVAKKPVEVGTMIDMSDLKQSINEPIIRNRWVEDVNLPLFWENREYIDKFLKKE